MSRRCLAIVERAWRGTIEEQYADILWLSRVLTRLRCDTGVLLRGNAVCYAVRRPSAVALRIGAVELTSVYHQDRSVADLLADGVPVYVSQEDCDRLGIAPEQLLPGVARTDIAGAARLCVSYDCVWYW